MPAGWQMYHHGVDYILPSSQYSPDIFLKNGVPASKLAVVPHGVYREMFHPGIPPFRLHTQKRVKFLHNAIPHHRKLHERVIGAYLDAFTGDDDVCLVLKTKFLQPTKDKPFEIDVRAILERLLRGRANQPEIEVVTSFVPDIGPLYTACRARRLLAITVRLYARRKGWKLEDDRVTLAHDRVHAKDCADCESRDGFLDVFPRRSSWWGT